jgi:bifunctional non-homologous end joining protein LigD
LLDYYAKAWSAIEPFVVNRPLSVLRAPDGIPGKTFFQKHASRGMHTSISKMKDPQDGKDLLYIWNFNGLAVLV